MMLGSILVCLFAMGRCVDNASLSLLQVRADLRTNRTSDINVAQSKEQTVSTEEDANPVTAQLAKLRDLLHKDVEKPSSKSSKSYTKGCKDPAATNYDKEAAHDDKSCYYGTQPPDELYTYSDTQRMHPDDALVMYQLLNALGQIFDKYNVKWWVTDGSLLGSIRNKGIIPHDDDIDLNILAPQMPFLKTPEFNKDLRLNGLHLDYQYHDDRMYVWNYAEFQRSHRKQNERGTRMKLDLWPVELGSRNGKAPRWHYLQVEDNSWGSSICREAGKPMLPDTAYTYPAYHCKLERVPFGNDFVWAPSKTTSVDYLVRKYGTWDKAPECVGTLHDCNLIKNMTHDLVAFAEPAGPLTKLIRS